MKRGTGWPVSVAVILGLTIAANVWLIRVATTDPTFAIEPDYYRKAIHWDDELAQRRRNQELGWSLTPTLSDARPGASRLLDVALTDRDGAPLSGASVDVVAVHNMRASHPVQARLVDSGGGVYRAAIPMDHVGLWQLRFEVHRGLERFTAEVRLEAERGGS